MCNLKDVHNTTSIRGQSCAAGSLHHPTHKVQLSASIGKERNVTANICQSFSPLCPFLSPLSLRHALSITVTGLYLQSNGEVFREKVWPRRAEVKMLWNDLNPPTGSVLGRQKPGLSGLEGNVSERERRSEECVCLWRAGRSRKWRASWEMSP